MYYDYPTYDMAYAGDETGTFSQYMFGDDIMVAPIVTPTKDNTLTADTEIWIPPGTWIENESGEVYNADNSGNYIIKKSYDISQIPVFIRAGAIIPSIPVEFGQTIALAKNQYTKLIFTIYPGKTSGNTNMYEDDGYTMDYLSGKFVWTSIFYIRLGNTISITITSSGSYSEFPSSRPYIIRFANSFPLQSAFINDKVVTYSSDGGPNTWYYDGNEVTTVIESSSLSTTSTVKISATFSSTVSDSYMSSIKGIIKNSLLAKQTLDYSWATPGSQASFGGNLTITASIGEALSYLSGTDINKFSRLFGTIRTQYSYAVKEIQDIKPYVMPKYSLVQLFSSFNGRMDNVLCGTQNCYNAQLNWKYVRLRTEGYQPLANDTRAIPLQNYYSWELLDNYATTLSSPPAKYGNSSFDNGYILKSYAPGSVPVKVYWNEERHDMLTVASQEGINYAKENGYVLVNDTIGYAYTNPPTDETIEISPLGLSIDQWLRAIKLLLSAVV